MHLLYLKPLLYTALSLPSLSTQTPEIIDFVIISRHATLLNCVSHTIRHSSMLNSIKKFCVERFPAEFIKIMQTPIPSINTINSYFYPEVTEIIKGTRSYDEKKYAQITKSINDILEKQKISREKYEYVYDNPIQQDLNIALTTQFNRALEYKKHKIIFEDHSFKSLLVLMILYSEEQAHKALGVNIAIANRADTRTVEAFKFQKMSLAAARESGIEGKYWFCSRKDKSCEGAQKLFAESYAELIKYSENK